MKHITNSIRRSTPVFSAFAWLLTQSDVMSAIDQYCAQAACSYELIVDSLRAVYGRTDSVDSESVIESILAGEFDDRSLTEYASDLGSFDSNEELEAFLAIADDDDEEPELSFNEYVADLERLAYQRPVYDFNGYTVYIDQNTTQYVPSMAEKQSARIIEQATEALMELIHSGGPAMFPEHFCTCGEVPVEYDNVCDDYGRYHCGTCGFFC